MAVTYYPPLNTGTEETVKVASGFDQEDELEIVFERCGLGDNAPDFERYLTVEQVEELHAHLGSLLERRRQSGPSIKL